MKSGTTPAVHSMHVHEVRPRKDHRGVDLISDALPFGRLWYDGPNAISSAIDYAKFFSRSHDAVIRVYDEAGKSVIASVIRDISIAYVYGAGDLIAEKISGHYYYHDGSGSTSHLADVNGNLLEWYRYDLQGTPFVNGDVNTHASAYGVRHLFTGQQWYSELGLYDLRNRFYSPDLGRFLQSDPSGFDGDPTNLYRYCGNNPLKASDPNGLSGIFTIYSNYFQALWPGYVGHSWVSFTSDQTGMTGFYGTYPNGMHYNDGYSANVIRQTWINDNAQYRLYQTIATYVALGEDGWGVNGNCTEFATAAWAAATGESVNRFNSWEIGSPSAVADSIKVLNGGHDYAFHFSDGSNGYYFGDAGYGRYDANGNGYYIWDQNAQPGAQTGVTTDGEAIYQSAPLPDDGGTADDWGFGLNPFSSLSLPGSFGIWGGGGDSPVMPPREL
jgi:RHS repeat-associated protein